MEIRKEAEGTALTVYLSGRLDAVTALQLDKDLQTTLNGITDLTLDLANLGYISSAGLRILLKTQKRMDRQGKMQIRNVRDNVREVLFMTGFAEFLSIVDDNRATFSASSEVTI